jgi:D-alanyl-D-alanine-carboxypeptidase/D-alanyl-D-alanine-endopeptidase
MVGEKAEFARRVRSSPWAKALRPKAGAVAGLLSNGNVEFVELGDGIDATTPMEVGSVTKGFTGLLLAQAIERGELKLDTRVDDALFGENWPGAPAVTLLDLATHTSGLPRLGMPALVGLLGNPYRWFNRSHIQRSLRKMKPRTPAMPRFSYSNFGYAALGLALERASSKPYTELLHERLLDPLKLQHTRLQMVGSNSLVTGGYNMFGLRASPWHFHAYAPCGALVSTAQDLLKAAGTWCEPVGPFASSVVLATQLRRSVLGGSIGLAWLQPSSGNYVWHNGGTYGYQAYLAFAPASNAAVVLLANQYGAKEITGLGHELMRWVLPN